MTEGEQTASILCKDVASRLERATEQLHEERLHSEQRVTKIETVLERTAEALEKLTDVVSQNQTTLAVLESTHRNNPLEKTENKLQERIDELSETVIKMDKAVALLQEKSEGNITSDRVMRGIWTLVGAGFSGLLVFIIVKLMEN